MQVVTTFGLKFIKHLTFHDADISAHAVHLKNSLPFCFLAGSRVTLNLLLDANFALYRIQRHIGVSVNFSCGPFFFYNVVQRKIMFSMNSYYRLIFPNDYIGLFPVYNFFFIMIHNDVFYESLDA